MRLGHIHTLFFLLPFKSKISHNPCHPEEKRTLEIFFFFFFLVELSWILDSM